MESFKEEANQPSANRERPPSAAGPPAPLAIPDHTLVRRIGTGGYGEVWLARSVLGQYRAVKVVRRSSFPEERPFLREFEGIRQFEPISRQHASQVDILHVGRAEDCFYYVMELADDANAPSNVMVGEAAGYAPKTLKTELARRGALPLPECLEIALALTTALQDLHDHGLVHRDVKPSNIIFVGGVPKLADIGLVAASDATHSFVGTTGYMAPEGPGAPQADLYSLGKVLYEISTGRPRDDFPEPLSEWGAANAKAWPDFFEVVLKACEPDPRRRYPSARAMRAELELLKHSKSVRHFRLLERRLALARRAGLAAAALLVMVVSISGFVFYEQRQVLRQAQRADREARQARQAEQAAQTRLREAQFAQAQALRWSGRPGRRFTSLELLRQVARQYSSLELRNEVIACLALPDLRIAQQLKVPLPGGGLVQFDAHYQHYAQADSQGRFGVHRLRGGAEVAVLPRLETPVHALEFSPDGRLLAVSAGDHGVHLQVWDWARGQRVFDWTNAFCRTVHFGPDNRRLAVGQFPPGGVVVLEVPSGRPLAKFAPPGLPYAVRFSPDGGRLAVSSEQSDRVQVYESDTGRLVFALAHPGPCRNVSWHPSGAWLATACEDSRVHLWDAVRGQERCTLSGHQAAVVHTAFSPSGDLLFSMGWDGWLKLWAPWADQLLLSVPTIGGGYVPSQDGRWFAQVSSKEDLTIYEIAPALELRRLHGFGEKITARAGVFSPEGRCVAAACREGLRCWELSGTGPSAFAPAVNLWTLAFHPAGDRVYVGGEQGVREWPLRVEGASGSVVLGPSPRSISPAGMVEQLELSRDGSVLRFVLHGALYAWPTDAAAPARQPVCDCAIELAASSPDGRLVAGRSRAAWDRQMALWDVPACACLKRLPTHGDAAAAFSPDGRWLAVGDHAQYQLWSTSDWTPGTKVARSQESGVRGCLAFSPDGRILATAFSRSTVRLLEAPSGRELATLEPPEATNIRSLAFNRDGSQLAVCRLGTGMEIWNLSLIRRQLAAMGLDW